MIYAWLNFIRVSLYSLLDYSSFLPFSVPSPPTVLQPLKITSTSILLTWGPPSYSGGSQVTYKVEYRGGGFSSHIRTSRTSINITGLQPGTNYAILVYAENSFGRSRPAATIVETIMATSMCVAAARQDTLFVTFVLPLHSKQL